MPPDVAVRPIRSSQIPDPITFSRDGYSDVLADHARLLEEGTPRLLWLTGRFDDEPNPYNTLPDLAGRIVEEGERAYAFVQGRVRTGTDFALYHGIHRALLAPKESSLFHVVISAGGVVSLQVLRLDGLDETPQAPRFAVAVRNVVVEPSDQRHVHVAGWTITRWVDASGVARYQWAVAPPVSPSPKEEIDRVFAVHESRVREKVTAWLASAPGEGPVVHLGSHTWGGDMIQLGPRVTDIHAIERMRDRAPEVAKALAARPPAGFVPVCVALNNHLGLRWLSVGEGRTEPAVRPPGIEQPTCARGTRGGDLEQDEQPEDTNPGFRLRPKAPPLPELPRERDPIEMRKASGAFAGIPRLVVLNTAELEREIAAAGFDPLLERTKAPGLREEVVLGILRRRPLN
jgi:hypothetical protein